MKIHAHPSGASSRRLMPRVADCRAEDVDFLASILAGASVAYMKAAEAQAATGVVDQDRVLVLFANALDILGRLVHPPTGVEKVFAAASRILMATELEAAGEVR